MTAERGTLASVQALRALAALGVVLYHVDFIGRGAFGVDVFFVISGFIICYVTAADPSRFLTKRLIRIVPLYWAGTLAVFALALAAPGLVGATTSSYADLAKSLAFIPYEKEPGRVVPVLFLGWTLNYEMFFYVVYAVALRATRKAALTSALAMGALVAMATVFNIDSVAWRFYTSPIVFEFCFGMGLYFLWRRFNTARGAVPIWFAAAVILCALAWMTAVDVPFDSPFRFVLWGIPAALVVAAALVLQSRVAFPLLLVAIGDASYSLYLFHPYVLKAIEKSLGRLDHVSPMTLAAAAAYIATAVVCALCAYRWFEKPMLRILRRRLIPSMDYGASPAPGRPRAAHRASSSLVT